MKALTIFRQRLYYDLIRGRRGRTLLWHKRFWLAIFIPSIISAIVWLGIMKDNAVHWWTFDFSEKGLQLAYALFQWPLAIWATSLPLVALVASVHRSEQVAEQIHSSNAQNTFSNYFLHRDKFFEQLDRLSEELSIEFRNFQNLYETLFPENDASHIDVRSTGGSIDTPSILYEWINHLNVATIAINKSVSSGAISGKSTEEFMNSLMYVCSSIGFTPTDHSVAFSPKLSDAFKGRAVLWQEESRKFDHFFCLQQILEAMAVFCHLPDRTQVIQLSFGDGLKAAIAHTLTLSGDFDDYLNQL